MTHPVGTKTALPRPVPWWIHAIDVAILVLAVLVIAGISGWAPRIRVTDFLLISIRSWLRPFLWMVGLLVVRHLAWRDEPWHGRVVGWARRLAAWEPLRVALPAFLVSRLAVLLVGYAAVATVGIPRRAFRGLQNDFFDLFARWDGGWYYGIAGVGYTAPFSPERQNAIAFFPGLPLLMRWTARLLDVNLWYGGIIVVSVAFLWGLTYVYRLAGEFMPRDQARASVLLLAFYPFAVCFSAVLTEAPFLLCATAAFYHFRRNELIKAAVAGIIAGVLRPNGFLLAAPLGILALVSFAQGRRWVAGASGAQDARWAVLVGRLTVACLPVAGMLAYSAYIYSLHGDPFAWAKAQQAWGRGSAEIVNVFVDHKWTIQNYGLAAYLRGHVVDLFEALSAVFALALVWPISRRFGIAYGLFVVISVLPSFITLGFVSLGRYTAPLFPIFLCLGASIPAASRPYWLAAFASGQALVAVLFYTWRAPY